MLNENHWFYKKWRNELEFPAKWLPYQGQSEVLREFGIHLNKDFSKRWLINWDCYKPSYSFSYSIDNNVEWIKAALYESQLSTHSRIIALMGPGLPPLIASSTFFIEHWDDFELVESLGIIVLSEDGSLLMEFTNENIRMLRSNFQIMPTIMDSKFRTNN